MLEQRISCTLASPPAVNPSAAHAVEKLAQNGELQKMVLTPRRRQPGASDARGRAAVAKHDQ